MNKNDLTTRVKTIMEAPKNEKLLGELIVKMGRVVAKKQMLQNQYPILAYDNRLWIGNYSQANNCEFLQQNQIKIVVSCLELSLSLSLVDVEYKCFPLKDGVDERFQSMVLNFIEYIDSHSGNILLHCFSGRSRSVAMLLPLLIRRNKIAYDEALSQLRKIYPIAAPNPYFEKILRTMEKQLHFSQQNSDLLSHLQPQSKDLLGQYASKPALSPKKNDENQFNLLEIQEVKPTTVIDLFEPIVLSPNPGDNSPNLINIFQSSAQAKNTSDNNIELLDLTQEEKIKPYETIVENITKTTEADEQLLNFTTTAKETVAETLEVKPSPKEKPEAQSFNLLGEPQAVVKEKEQQQFADSIDFTQKKVKGKKNKKK